MRRDEIRRLAAELGAAAVADRATHGRTSIVPSDRLRALCREAEHAQTPERIHRLKTDPDVFEEVATGRKTFEVRRADRDYQLGDALVLHEYDRARADRHAVPDPGYTGRTCTRLVTFILGQGRQGPGAAYAGLIDSQHVILGLAEL